MGSQGPARSTGVLLLPPSQGDLLSTLEASPVRNGVLQGGSQQGKAKCLAAGEGVL